MTATGATRARTARRSRARGQRDVSAFTVAVLSISATVIAFWDLLLLAGGLS